MIQRYIAVFFRWWVTQLVSVVPKRWLQSFAAASDAVVVKIVADRVHIRMRRDGAFSDVGTGRISELRALISGKPGMPRLELLQLGLDQGLRKTLTLPESVRRDLDATLGFEIARETPFEQGEVYWNYRISSVDPANRKIEVELVVVPRRSVDPLLQITSQAGLKISALEIDLGGPTPALIWIETSQNTSWISPRRKLVPLAATAGALAIAVIVLPFALQELNLFLANRSIEAIGPQARQAAALKLAANQRLAAVQFFGRSHGANGSALSTLAAVTAALPNDTYLSSLSLHDGKLTLVGSSEAAGHVIGSLAVSPALRDPVFDSPVVEGEDDQEKFTVSASLVQAGAP